MIGRSLKPPQSALFDQFIAKPREPIAGLVVAEMRSGEHAKQDVSDTRTVAVAVLEPKSNRVTDARESRFDSVNIGTSFERTLRSRERSGR